MQAGSQASAAMQGRLGRRMNPAAWATHLWGCARRYEDVAAKAGGAVWVRYTNGAEAPLEGRSNAALCGCVRARGSAGCGGGGVRWLLSR